jgi:cobalt/nickel transport system permease protein
MHIPDGYLSPATCAVMYAAAAPFWSTALRRMRDVVAARTIPMVSLVAAFSFVIMMFNIPLPGGTTGHAIGIGIAAIVLGPWGAMLSISVALAIQALMFGDGGILALGANCFNIAIAGALVASASYRLVAFRATAGSRRRVVAAAVAGYAACNVSALLTAVELGLQPMLFHDAAGVPLYAPYPLRIAVPAMMLGHLTIAGLAEAALAGGVISWLQRAKPAMLVQQSAPPMRWAALRPLMAGLALLLILTPIGLAASGSAWGEWGAEQFANAEARREIERVSQGAPLPDAVPGGMIRWSVIWDAPASGYALLSDGESGYFLSAVFGAGMILGVALAVDASMRRRRLSA